MSIDFSKKPEPNEYEYHKGVRDGRVNIALQNLKLINHLITDLPIHISSPEVGLCRLLGIIRIIAEFNESIINPTTIQ